MLIDFSVFNNSFNLLGCVGIKIHFTRKEKEEKIRQSDEKREKLKISQLNIE